MARLRLTRKQILAFRRNVGALDQRLPAGRRSLLQAAWAGLQDSMPRAALLSIHARVEGAGPSAWDDPSLVQVWGPRYQVYVVAGRDLAVFTLSRLPDAGKIRRRADDLAPRVHQLLDGERMRYGDAGRALGVHGNMLRYAALTGTLAIRWEGARQPLVWTVPVPELTRVEATRELARRFLHILGPGDRGRVREWAGIGAREALHAFEELSSELVEVLTPVGEASLLASDESVMRAAPPPRPLRDCSRAAMPTPCAARRGTRAPRSGRGAAGRAVDAACVAGRAARRQARSSARGAARSVR